MNRQTALVYVLLAVLLASPALAKEYHVSAYGDNANPGTPSKPLKTIQAAANKAQPGDVVTVHGGTYRERVNPPRGGTSPQKRITFRAAEGETPVIKGSEPVTGWEQTSTKGVWKLTLPSSFFGDYNPYRTLISGHWFNPQGREHHTGGVFLDGDALYEVTSGDKVADKEMTWYCEADDHLTHIWANFGGAHPADRLVEITVRLACFYPEEPGRDFITVRGFTMQQAASQWAPPTTEQVALFGTHWSKGWVIEDNEISHSRCAGITLGKDATAAENVQQSAGGYNRVIKEALNKGWSKETIGSHVVRNNVIHDCGQAGICGSMGGAFSRVTNNHIYDINANEPFGGAEIAGIKLHGAIDATIRDNHIHNAAKGIWLDWMSQGTRTTGNLCYNNRQQDFFSEVNHGPYLVDNNIFLSQMALRDWSQGGAFVHNLLAGNIRGPRQVGRRTPYHEAHSTELMGLSSIQGGDNRFYNNIFVGGPGLKNYSDAERPMRAGGNVYLGGAAPHEDESGALHLPDFEADARLVEEDGAYFLQLSLPQALRDHETELITTELLGKAAVTGLPYEGSDGTPVRVTRGYRGTDRSGDNPTAGPFEDPGTGQARLRLWPRRQ